MGIGTTMATISKETVRQLTLSKDLELYSNGIVSTKHNIRNQQKVDTHSLSDKTCVFC